MLISFTQAFVSWFSNGINVKINLQAFTLNLMDFQKSGMDGLKMVPII